MALSALAAPPVLGLPTMLARPNPIAGLPSAIPIAGLPMGVELSVELLNGVIGWAVVPIVRIQSETDKGNRCYGTRGRTCWCPGRDARTGSSSSGSGVSMDSVTSE